MIPTTPLLERLRDDTREALVHLEGLPLWAALKDGTLPRESYVLFLEAMHAVHEPLREPLGGQPDPRVTAFWDAMAARIPLLEEDLTYLQRDRPGRTTESLLHAIMLSEETVLRGRRDPASLAGFLYVLHTSPLGDSLLAPLLSQPYGLPGTEGLAFVQGSAPAQQAWGPFAEALQASTLDRDGQARAVDAALEAVEGLERIAEQLHPLVLEDDPDTLGHVLNPGAGRHVVAEDPRELRAALRAGVRSWERFPYYERRYGRRGRRFTRSDSAWLVTLASLPQSEVDRQIRWLGQVLAARGMPRWMLELHLEVLHEELVLSVPRPGTPTRPCCRLPGTCATSATRSSRSGYGVRSARPSTPPSGAGGPGSCRGSAASSWPRSPTRPSACGTRCPAWRAGSPTRAGSPRRGRRLCGRRWTRPGSWWMRHVRD